MNRCKTCTVEVIEDPFVSGLPHPECYLNKSYLLKKEKEKLLYSYLFKKLSSCQPKRKRRCGYCNFEPSLKLSWSRAPYLLRVTDSSDYRRVCTAKL